MGNKSSPSISLSNYSKPGLSEGELIEIYSFFNSLEPKDGKVEISKINEIYGNSEDGKKFCSQFLGMTSIDFDSFIDICHKDIQEKKKNFKNVEVDVDDPQVSCFYCPYPTYQKREQTKQGVNCCSS